MCTFLTILGLIYYILYFAGKPGRPSEPIKAKALTKDSLELSWQPPEHDGGSPITGYIIEKRDKAFSRWTHLEKTADDSTSAILKRLQTGSELHFKVAAVNKLGTGEALEMSKPVLIKSPYGELTLHV